ncbi:MAG: alginate export family protein [Bacteroidales bacterium]
MPVKSTTAIIVALVCLAQQTFAQFTLNGEFRPRMEYRHGFQTLMDPDENAAFFISQRSRLNLGMNEENYSVGFSLQDIRVWGEVPQLNRSDINSSVHEAWVDLKIFNKAFLRAGRQEIIYDNSRIFGNVDWAQQARSHDAAVLKWNLENDLILHAGLAFNQESERVRETFYSLNNYKTFQYFWLNKSWEKLSGSFLFLNNGIQFDPAKTTFSQTTGSRLVYNPGNFSLSGSAYLQTGRDAANRTLNAHYISLHYDQPLTLGGLGLTAGFELLSGTDQANMQDPGNRSNTSFSPLYGTNHAFNGHMDYFYVGNHFNNAGLRDLYAGLNYNPRSWSAGFRLHFFSSDALLVNPATPSESMPRYLGTEVDIFFGYNLYENIVLRMGYSEMFATESMEVLKGGSKSETNNWAWMMLIVKPEFLNIPR